MIITEVDAGACGFKTTIRARASDTQTVQLDIQSECPDIQKAAEELKEVDAAEEAFGRIGTTLVYRTAAQYCKHGACPVPMAVIKTAEAAAGLALPKNVTVIIDKTED